MGEQDSLSPTFPPQHHITAAFKWARRPAEAALAVPWEDGLHPAEGSGVQALVGRAFVGQAFNAAGFTKTGIRKH